MQNCYILRHLIIVLASNASPGCAAGAGCIPKEYLNSRKLAPKLSQQLQDVLAICGGGLPAWTHALTAQAPFLFPFEARR
eukprot:scaffold204516_cov19-Prasinocladus_malaysianus.AAC.1